MFKLIFVSLKLVVIFMLVFPVVETDFRMTSKRWVPAAREAHRPQHRRPGLCGTGELSLGRAPWRVLGTAPGGGAQPLGAERCPQPCPSRREGARAEPCQHRLVISSDRIGMRNRI